MTTGGGDTRTRSSIFWAMVFSRGDRRIGSASTSSTSARPFPTKRGNRSARRFEAGICIYAVTRPSKICRGCSIQRSVAGCNITGGIIARRCIPICVNWTACWPIGRIGNTKSYAVIYGGRHIGLRAFPDAIRSCSLTGRWVCGVVPWREPYELRGSSTVLREPRGEIPRGYSPVSLNQLAIVIGILTAFSVNYGLAGIGVNSWRWMFGSAAIPSALFLLALTLVPESPRWLIEKGHLERAERALAGIAGSDGAAEEVLRIKAAIAEESTRLFVPSLRKPASLAVTLAILQQITGINTIMYYGSLIFLEQAPKQTDASALLANMTVGAVNLLCTVAAMFLVDRAGRRPLLLWACGGMALSLTALVAGIQLHGPAALFLIFVLLYVACFAVGMGPGVWIVMSEVFPTRVRGRAMSVATVCLWAACLLVTSTFLSLVNALTISGAFLLYAGISAAAFIFIWRAVPETKGRTLEEIERWWSHGGGSSA